MTKKSTFCMAISISIAFLFDTVTTVIAQNNLYKLDEASIRALGNRFLSELNPESEF